MSNNATELWPKKLTKPNGAFISEVFEQVLIGANCKISGHFRFQENGGNCMMCQHLTVARAKGYASGYAAAREEAAKVATTAANAYRESRSGWELDDPFRLSLVAKEQAALFIVGAISALDNEK